MAGKVTVPRPARSDLETLVAEVRALELLANEAEVPSDRIQEYWALAADLITLSVDIVDFQLRSPDAGYEDPEMLALRRRLRDVGARLSQLIVD